jgi:hypothetical protein
MSRARKPKHPRALKANEAFIPAEADEGDEIFRNGIFEFNITKMLGFIHDRPEEFVPEHIVVGHYVSDFSPINEDHMDSVHASEPVILAEIAPGRYNLIDGHHRIEKARRSGTEHIMAYRLNAGRHVQFLTSRKAYAAYVEYWNGKLED